MASNFKTDDRNALKLKRIYLFKRKKIQTNNKINIKYLQSKNQ